MVILYWIDHLANKGQYPAINVLKSISRLMNHISEEEHVKAAERFRDLYYTYDKSEDLDQYWCI